MTALAHQLSGLLVNPRGFISREGFSFPNLMRCRGRRPLRTTHQSRGANELAMHIGISAVEREQLFMVTTFDDVAVIED